MERVFSLTVGGTLPEPIPLGQMIDILIDSWEADGLFGKLPFTILPIILTSNNYLLD